MNNENNYERYKRQVSLEIFGEQGQIKLRQSGVLVIGAGGLGCPVLQYLTAAGIGRMGIVDDDIVQLHNLHRQVLFTTNDIGLNKAETAARRLRKMNPGVEIKEYPTRFTNQNALELIGTYDIVVDASDNFPTRYLVNDACVLLNKPLVFGAISEFEGQVAVFNYKLEENKVPVNYRDLFPDQPLPGTVLNCAEAGVLGVLPGIIGTMQANEVIKLLVGIGKPLVNQLLVYDALLNESFIYSLSARNETVSRIPRDETEFKEKDYSNSCVSLLILEEINSADFYKMVLESDVAIIDVREKHELPLVTEFAHLQIPLSQLKDQVPVIDNDRIVLFCQSGKRSREAAGILFDRFGPSRKIFSLKDGIVHWKQQYHGKEKT